MTNQYHLLVDTRVAEVRYRGVKEFRQTQRSVSFDVPGRKARCSATGQIYRHTGGHVHQGIEERTELSNTSSHAVDEYQQGQILWKLLRVGMLAVEGPHGTVGISRWCGVALKGIVVLEQARVCLECLKV